MASEKKFGWIEFFTGLAAGSLVSVILSRKDIKGDVVNFQKKAEEIRKQLINKARNISSELIERSLKFVESSKKFAEGKYSGTMESLEKEYYSIKFAINTAIDNYRRSSKIDSSNGENDELFIDFDDEKLPKFVGMGRRKR